jgi:predicted tellurium resistance membrane protein TerC
MNRIVSRVVGILKFLALILLFVCTVIIVYGSTTFAVFVAEDFGYKTGPHFVWIFTTLIAVILFGIFCVKNDGASATWRRFLLPLAFIWLL